MEENREILIFSIKKRIKQQHEQKVCAHSESANYQISTLWLTFKESNLFLLITNTNTYLYTHKWFHIYIYIYVISYAHECSYNFLMLCAFEFWFQFLEHSWMQPDEVGWNNQWYRSYPFSFGSIILKLMIY